MEQHTLRVKSLNVTHAVHLIERIVCGAWSVYELADTQLLHIGKDGVRRVTREAAPSTLPFQPRIVRPVKPIYRPVQFEKNDFLSGIVDRGSVVAHRSVPTWEKAVRLSDRIQGT